MKEHCIEAEDLERVMGLGAEDPRRKHLDDCPRCRALMAAYSDFLKPARALPGADLQDADARLKSSFDREIAREGRASRPATRRMRWSPPRPFGPTALWPVWAAAAAVIVVGVLYVVHQVGPGPDRLVLRGAPQGSSRPAALVLYPPKSVAGGLELRWRSAPGADTYQVRLFGSDLSERARLGPFADTAVVLRPAELASGIAPGTLLLWRVVALHAGDEIATSPVGQLRAP